MGYNTPVLILNDAAHMLETDPDVGRKISEAMSLSQRDRTRQVDFSIGNHANGGAVWPAEHADEVQVVAFGGNCMTKLGTVYGGWSQMTDPDKLLRSLATTLGYRLVKLPGRA